MSDFFVHILSKIAVSLCCVIIHNFTNLMCIFFSGLTRTVTKIGGDLLPHPQTPFMKTELRFDFFLSRHCSFCVPCVGFRSQTLHLHNSSTTAQNRVIFFHRRATLYSTHTRKRDFVPNPQHVQKDPLLNEKVDLSTTKFETFRQGNLAELS